MRRVIGRFIFSCVVLLVAPMPAQTPPAAGEAPRLSAWVAEWDLPAGWAERSYLFERLDSLQVFAAVFNASDQPYLSPELDAWIAANLPAGSDRPLLTVVNDVVRAEGNILKDPEVISRVLATPASREKHKRHLLDLLRSGRFSGLDMDYEKVKAEDWSVYLGFCRELSEELAQSGLRLRVVLEPKRRYFASPLPEGPEYVVMGYNLYGGHSGPGPKADAEFIARLAGWRKRSGRDIRLALATGGFAWSNKGRTESLTEAQAAALAARHHADVSRDVASRYLHFTFEDGDATREVWYADGIALAYLIDVARQHGFATFDIWRLGGNVPESLAAVKSALAFGASGRVVRVPAALPGESGAATIGRAIEVALPGDRIVVEPGEYRENISVSKPGLTISASPGGPVRILGVAGGPVLRDSADTRWRGIAFAIGDAEALAALDSFSGRFDYCRFEAASDVAPPIRILGGLPVFHGCEFVGADGACLGITGSAAAPGRPPALADFTYCRFEGFGGDMAHFSENVGARFANSLFTGNERLFGRAGSHRGGIELVNCVIYFNRTHNIAPAVVDFEPVLIDHSVYTPIYNYRLWTTGPTPDEHDGVLVRDSRCASPRFRDVGHRVWINFGIDDTRNIGVFEKLAEAGEAYGYKLTLAVNTDAATADDWERLNRLSGKGHEIGSHTASHIMVQKRTPLSLGYPAPAGRPALLTISDDRIMEVRVDGNVVFVQSLATPGFDILGLSRALTRAGFVVAVSPYVAGTPARFIAPIGPVDIGFAKAVVPLEIDMDAYVDYELGDSRKALLDHVPGLGDVVFINPFEISSDLAREAIDNYGYIAGRASIETSETDCIIGDPWSVSVYSLPSRSLASVGVRGDGKPPLENVRLVLDYLKLHQPMLSLYSHGWNECGFDDWKELMALAAMDPRLEVMTLAEMTARIKGEGEEYLRGPICPGTYRVEPRERGADYRPRMDSPLLGAGKRLGLARDFADTPIPSEGNPDIGLYQVSAASK